MSAYESHRVVMVPVVAAAIRECIVLRPHPSLGQSSVAGGRDRERPPRRDSVLSRLPLLELNSPTTQIVRGRNTFRFKRRSQGIEVIRLGR